MEFTIQTDGFYFSHAAYEVINTDAFSMHMHNDYEIIYMVSGNASFIIEDKNYKLRRNDLVIVQPQKYHYIQVDRHSKYERFNITFNSNILNLSASELIPEDFEIISCSDNDIIKDLFKRYNHYYSVFSEEILKDLFVCLLKELIYNITTCLKNDISDNYTTELLVSEILKFINKNLFTLDNIKMITEHFFISEIYVYKLFKRYLNIAPMRYVNEKRLLAAQNMILQGTKPTEVFEICGFNNYSTFYKNYIRAFGHAPSDDLIKK